MRVSVWQEWSSNHSGDFRIVGVFPSVEAAQRAAQAAWRLWGSYMDQEAREQAEHMADLSPAQQEDQRWLLELYLHEAAAAHTALGEQPVAQIPAEASNGAVEQESPAPPPTPDWSAATGVDWTSYVELAAPVMPWLQPLEIIAWDRMVILYNRNTWSPTPAAGYELLRTLGADVAALSTIEGAIITKLIVRVRCLAPETQPASGIVGPIRRYLASTGQRRQRMAPPWGPGFRLEATGSILRSGRHISIVAFFYWPEDGLPALVDYLATRGCTDIRYTIREGPPTIRLPRRSRRRHAHPAPRYRPLRDLKRWYAARRLARLLQARREQGSGT